MSPILLPAYLTACWTCGARLRSATSRHGRMILRDPAGHVAASAIKVDLECRWFVSTVLSDMSVCAAFLGEHWLIGQQMTTTGALQSFVEGFRGPSALLTPAHEMVMSEVIRQVVVRPHRRVAGDERDPSRYVTIYPTVRILTTAREHTSSKADRRTVEGMLDLYREWGWLPLAVPRQMARSEA